MNLLDFYRQYPDEASCESALRKFRKHHGLFCSQVSVSLTGSNCALAHINQDLNIGFTDWQHADIHYSKFCISNITVFESLLFHLIKMIQY